MQLGLHVHVQREHGGDDGGSHANRAQGGKSASRPQQQRAQQDARKHAPALHASPRKASTGSTCAARRMASALPASTIAPAASNTMGSRAACTVMAMPKMAWPTCRAMNPPSTKPAEPPSKAS